MKNRSVSLAAIALLLVTCLSAGAYLAERTGSEGLRAENERLLTESQQLIKENQRLSEEARQAKDDASQLAAERVFLQELNKNSVSAMSAEGGPIYVIGHKSPDSDTVISAVAYARLLRMLGYDAEARISAPVSNETAFILRYAGAETPPILEDASGENIFLVDHSEYLQSVDGMEDAHIVGIMDHHGVGTVNTGHQIVYEARPIGATATIVWLDYLNYGLEIDTQTAQLLLGAVLSDTSGLNGTTTIDADRKAAEELAKLAGVSDIDALYAQIHAESLSYEGFSDLEILFSDYKEYEAGGTSFAIGAVNAIDDDAAKDLCARMKNALAEGFGQKNVDLMYASVGIRENGEKIDYIVPAEGLSKQVFEEAFPNYDEYDGTAYIFRTGLGRKTLFVPGMTEHLNAHPRE